MILDQFDRAELQGRLAEAIVEGMDMDTLVQYAEQSLGEAYDKLTDEQLLAEIREFQPSLLED